MRALVSEIREINEYIKKYYLKLSVVLFAVYLLVSFVTCFVVADLPAERIDGVWENLKVMYQLDTMMEKHGFDLFWAIFVHNLKGAGLNIVSAIVPFVFFPIRSILTNGLASGMVYGVSIYLGIENLFLQFLKYVLPHAIFEIPIFILSCAIGLRLCVWILKKIFRKAKDESLKYHFEKISEVMFFYIVPFLLWAAFLEGIVEPFVFGL